MGNNQLGATHMGEKSVCKKNMSDMSVGEKHTGETSGGGSCLEGTRRGQIGGKNGGPEDAF